MDARKYAQSPGAWVALGVLGGLYAVPGSIPMLWVIFALGGLLGLGFSRLMGRWGRVPILLLGLALGALLLQRAQPQVPTGSGEMPIRELYRAQLRVVQDSRPTPYGVYLLAELLPAPAEGAEKLHVLVYLPQDTPPLRMGETWRVSGALGPLESLGNETYRAYVRRLGVGGVVRATAAERVSPSGRLLGLRSELLDRVDAAHPDSSTRILLKALLLGDRSGITPEVRTAFQISGTAHLLAVSGQHLSVLLLTVSFLLGTRRKGGGLRGFPLALALGLLWLYVPLTGSSPSVVRAALMASMGLLAVPLERPGMPVNYLAISCIIQVCFQPLTAFDLSFQLSYAASAGILLLLPVARPWLAGRHPVVGAAGGLAAVSLAAQLATLPFQWAVFGQIPTYALLTNLIAVPLSSLLLVGGWAWLLLEGVPGLGTLLGGTVHYLSRALLWLTEWTASLPGAIWEVPLIPTGVALLVGGAVLVLLLERAQRTKSGLTGWVLA